MTPDSVLGAKTIEWVETAPSVPQGRSTPGIRHCALGGDECSGDTGEEGVPLPENGGGH